MDRNLVGWARETLTAAGVAMVVGFFLAWLDVFDRVSGFDLAWDSNSTLFLVPLAGIALAFAARGPWARIAALGAGLLVVGDVMFQIVHGVLDAGLATWLILGGAGMALAGISEARRGLRLVAGLAILAGFFAPWDDTSMFDFLRTVGFHGGLTVAVLWFVMIGGVCALAAAAGGARAKLLSAAAGVLVLGSITFSVASTLWTVSAWGAWITLGASVTALLIGVIAPHAKPGDDADTDARDDAAPAIAR
jgi:hypothetical protein|nr:hypothetical protein [Kofleriaceae bacterium]